MTDAAEEARALAWRQQQARRLQARKLQLAALTPSPEPAAQVKANWQPLLDWLREQNLNED